MSGRANHNSAMIRLIVFDLDGTLVDSQKDLANAANALIRELGGRPLPDEAIVRMVGEGAAVLVRRALTAAAIDPGTPGALDRFLDIYDQLLLDHTVPYRGTMEMLIGVSGRYPLAVLTNKPTRATARILDGVGLIGFFSEVIGGDTGFGRKPAPAALAHLADAHGANAASTLLVGDSAVDLETARRAGARICLARYGFGFRFQATDFRGDEHFIDAPTDLLPLVAALP